MGMFNEECSERVCSVGMFHEVCSECFCSVETFQRNFEGVPWGLCVQWVFHVYVERVRDFCVCLWCSISVPEQNVLVQKCDLHLWPYAEPGQVSEKPWDEDLRRNVLGLNDTR